ncbi:MAG: hypothetical protein ACTSPB_16590 [Candidatus Thorarchaeota archaeon]
MKGMKASQFGTAVLGILLLVVFTVSAANTTQLHENLTMSVTISNLPPNIKFENGGVKDIVGGATIDLNPDTVQVVWCNGTIVDPNGYTDISQSSLNVTFHKASVDSGAADDNNNHYSNGTGSNSATDCDWSSGSGDSISFTCAMEVWYYADGADSWNCTVSVLDSASTPNTATNSTNISINQFLGLDVWNSTISFDASSLGDNATTEMTIVKNTCNQAIDIQLREANWTDGSNGYMNCSSATASSGWITTNNYVTYNASNYKLRPENSTTLTGANVKLDVNLPQQTTDGFAGNVTAPVYWGLMIPYSGVSGECFGIVEYTAVANS